MTDTEPPPVFKPLPWDVDIGRTLVRVTSKETGKELLLRIEDVGKVSSDGTVNGYACRVVDTKELFVVALGDSEKYDLVLCLCVEDKPPAVLYKDPVSPTCAVIDGRRVVVLAEGCFYETRNGQLFLLDSITKATGSGSPDTLHGFKIYR